MRFSDFEGRLSGDVDEMLAMWDDRRCTAMSRAKRVEDAAAQIGFDALSARLVRRPRSERRRFVRAAARWLVFAERFVRVVRAEYVVPDFYPHVSLTQGEIDDIEEVAGDIRRRATISEAIALEAEDRIADQRRRRSREVAGEALPKSLRMRQALEDMRRANGDRDEVLRILLDVTRHGLHASIVKTVEAVLYRPARKRII